MKRFLTILLVICTAMGVVSFAACEKKAEKYSAYSFDYFDTVTTITGYEKDKATFDAVSSEALALLGEYHRLFTIYHRFDGLENLCTVNELVDGAHRTVTVDRKIIDMLLYAKEMYVLTNGRVNVAMGSVLSIWHDHREIGMNDPSKATLPDKDELWLASQHTNINDVVIDEENCTVTLADPEMKLDVGAIAKGYAVEMVAKALEQKEIEGYVINVGGNVRTLGAKADGEAWTVGIENPDDEATDYLAYLGLSGESLVTSGSYQRYYFVNGRRYHHIIDPVTLMPSDYFTSVSIVCKSSGLGDALSTALFCMTLEEGRALIESIEDVEAMWVTLDGQIHKSSGFESYEKK